MGVQGMMHTVDTVQGMHTVVQGMHTVDTVVQGMHTVVMVIYPNKDALLSSTRNIHLHSDTFILAKSHIVQNETDKTVTMHSKRAIHHTKI